MTTAILSLATLLFGILFWFLKRRDAQTNDPLEQNRKRYEEIDRDIATQDSAAAAVHSNSDLDELDRLHRAEAGGAERRPN
jgi:hypothetical protein